MAYPAVTYTFTNGTTASATEVNQNFTDLINGLSDGTKDLSISALTVAGTASLNGAVNIGNATSDDIAVNGYITTALIPKADDSYDLGTAALAWQDAYFDGRVYTDTISELTAAAGVTIDSLLIKDGSISASAVLGSTSGSAPAAGVIGETQSISRVRSSNTGLTTNVTVNVGTTTKITLNKGVYLFNASIGFIAATNTVVSQLDLAISKTSATLPASGTLCVPTSGEIWLEQGFGDNGSNVDMSMSTSYPVVVASDATDFYLVARALFTTDTLGVYGSFSATRIG
jgi:hypothetical protein